jgi:hypothetical protein
MVLVRQAGIPLNEQLDRLLGGDVRCPEGISVPEWITYLHDRQQRERLGLRLDHIIDE